MAEVFAVAAGVQRFHVENYGTFNGVDDTQMFQDTAAAITAAGGGAMLVGPRAYKARNITFGNTISYEVVGTSGVSACRIAPPDAFPSSTVFDLTNSNGPAKYFRSLKITGVFGSTLSTGIKCSTTNGLRLRDVWLGGHLVGLDWIDPCSDLDASGVILESCGQGMNFRNNPTAVNLRGIACFDNAQDFQVVGACKTFNLTDYLSFRSTNTAFLASSATDLAISSFRINGAVNGINLTSSPETMLTDGEITDSITADFVNSGTLRIYAHNVRANFAPFYGAGIYLGAMIGGKRDMLTRGVATTLPWAVGDHLREETPVVGQPKGWYVTAAGTPGTHVSEGNL